MTAAGSRAEIAAAVFLKTAVFLVLRHVQQEMITRIFG